MRIIAGTSEKMSQSSVFLRTEGAGSTFGHLREYYAHEIKRFSFAVHE